MSAFFANYVRTRNGKRAVAYKPQKKNRFPAKFYENKIMRIKRYLKAFRGYQENAAFARRLCKSRLFCQ